MALKPFGVRKAEAKEDIRRALYDIKAKHQLIAENILDILDEIIEDLTATADLEAEEEEAEEEALEED